MGEWETGLNAAHDRGVIDAEMRDRLAAMEFDRESPPDSFPMRIALIVLGAILLVSAGFAIFIRLVPDDPSQLLVSAMLLGVAAVAEAIAWIVRRTNAVAFLAGIVGSFAGNGDRTFVWQRVGYGQKARCSWRMRWIAIKKAQPNVHQTVSTVGWHHDGELFDETTAISRRNLARSSRLVL